MAWSDAARAAALEARRLHAKKYYGVETFQNAVGAAKAIRDYRKAYRKAQSKTTLTKGVQNTINPYSTPSGMKAYLTRMFNRIPQNTVSRLGSRLTIGRISSRKK